MCLDADDYCPYDYLDTTPGQVYDEWVHKDKEPKGDLDELEITRCTRCNEPITAYGDPYYGGDDDLEKALDNGGLQQG